MYDLLPITRSSNHSHRHHGNVYQGGRENDTRRQVARIPVFPHSQVAAEPLSDQCTCHLSRTSRQPGPLAHGGNHLDRSTSVYLLLELTICYGPGCRPLDTGDRSGWYKQAPQVCRTSTAARVRVKTLRLRLDGLEFKAFQIRHLAQHPREFGNLRLHGSNPYRSNRVQIMQKICRRAASRRRVFMSSVARHLAGLHLPTPARVSFCSATADSTSICCKTAP